MISSPAQIVTEFLQSFMSGDVDRARELVGPDFSYRAPFGGGGIEGYFAGAPSKAKLISAFRILRQWTDSEDVSTIYEIDIRTDEGEATITMSEWHKVSDSKIRSTFMIFNTASPGVGLMARALSSHA